MVGSIVIEEDREKRLWGILDGALVRIEGGGKKMAADVGLTGSVRLILRDVIN